MRCWTSRRFVGCVAVMLGFAIVAAAGGCAASRGGQAGAPAETKNEAKAGARGEKTVAAEAGEPKRVYPRFKRSEGGFPHQWLVLGFAHPYNSTGAAFLVPLKPQIGNDYKFLFRDTMYFGNQTELARYMGENDIAFTDLVSDWAPGPTTMLTDYPSLSRYQFAAFITPAEPWQTAKVEKLPEVSSAISSRGPRDLYVVRVTIPDLPDAGLIILPPIGHRVRYMCEWAIFFRDWTECERAIDELGTGNAFWIAVEPRDAPGWLEFYTKNAVAPFNRETIPEAMTKKPNVVIGLQYHSLR